MANPERILITGLGAVCAAGGTVERVFEALRAGQSAIGPIRQWESGQWPDGRAAEIADVDKRTLVPDRKLHKMIGRTDFFGLYAADAAVDQAGFIPYRETLAPAEATHYNDRTGVFTGSGGGTYRCSYDFLPLMAAARGDLQVFGRELGSTVTPMWLLRNLPNNVLCHFGIRHGFKGANGCVTNHCVSGAQAVLEAAASLRTGDADRMVAVGYDAPIEPETVLYYHRAGLLSIDTVRPFDHHPSGTVLGEGAAAVAMETARAARARSATVLGEFLGAGCTTEGTGILEIRTDGDGVSRAIELALTDAGMVPSEVGMIVAHGNGNRKSDASEAAGIRRVFGESIPPVTAFKWAYGHPVAASGILDSVVALAALRAGLVPGIATLEALDPQLAPLPVSPSHQSPRTGTALIVCRGFGGMNVALLVGTPPDAMAWRSPETS